jgi:hypothetical protein
MTDTPLYASKRTGKSLWQQYRVYDERVELQSWFLFHTVVIRADQIQGAEVRPSVFCSDAGFTWGIKLDNCDLGRHVLLTKKRSLQANRILSWQPGKIRRGLQIDFTRPVTNLPFAGTHTYSLHPRLLLQAAIPAVSTIHSLIPQ